MTAAADAGDKPRRRIPQGRGIGRKRPERGQRAADQGRSGRLAIPLRHALFRREENEVNKSRAEETPRPVLPLGQDTACTKSTAPLPTPPTSSRQGRRGQ